MLAVRATYLLCSISLQTLVPIVLLIKAFLTTNYPNLKKVHVTKKATSATVTAPFSPFDKPSNEISKLCRRIASLPKKGEEDSLHDAGNTNGFQ